MYFIIHGDRSNFITYKNTVLWSSLKGPRRVSENLCTYSPFSRHLTIESRVFAQVITYVLVKYNCWGLFLAGARGFEGNFQPESPDIGFNVAVCSYSLSSCGIFGPIYGCLFTRFIVSFHTKTSQFDWVHLIYCKFSLKSVGHVIILMNRYK